MPERPVEADIGHVVAAELEDECNIDDEVGISGNVWGGGEMRREKIG